MLALEEERCLKQPFVCTNNHLCETRDAARWASLLINWTYNVEVTCVCVTRVLECWASLLINLTKILKRERERERDVNVSDSLGYTICIGYI